MQRPHLIILFSLFTFSLFSQGDIIYRRGWQLSASIGPEREPTVLLNAGVRTSDTAVVNTLIGPSPLSIRPEFIGGDSLYYLYDFRRPDEASRPERTQRYNFQLRAHRRYLSGLEFAFGLFYSAGSIGAERNPPDELPADINYFTYEEQYSKLGLSTGIHYNLLKVRRFQPYLGINMLFLRQSFTLSNFMKILPAQGFAEPTERGNNSERSVVQFRLDLRPIVGFNYAITPRLSAGWEVSPLIRQYAGAQVRYRITEY